MRTCTTSESLPKHFALLTSSTVAYPRCSDSVSYYTSDCGSPPGAFILFISWNVLSM